MRQVALLRQVTNLEPANRVAALILKMGRAAQQVRVTSGKDVITAHEVAISDAEDFA